MAKGWAGEDAVQEEIDGAIADGVARARSYLPHGESLVYCEECDRAIPQARREAVPGVRLCVECQSQADAREQAAASYNRRGSKDSQLR